MAARWIKATGHGCVAGAAWRGSDPHRPQSSHPEQKKIPTLWSLVNVTPPNQDPGMSIGKKTHTILIRPWGWTSRGDRSDGEADTVVFPEGAVAST